MSNSDFSAAINELVAEHVAAALVPYKSVLERMSAFFGDDATVKRRGPGRPRKTAAKVDAPVAPVRRRRRRRGAKAKAAAPAAVFADGQKVTFKVGRAVQEAKVVRVDAKTGALILERTSDGARMTRLPAKVQAA
jgi:hypothetical protein